MRTNDNHNPRYWSLDMKLFVGYSKALKQPQSSASPICQAHIMTSTGRDILIYQGVHCCTKVCNLHVLPTVRVVIQPESSGWGHEPGPVTIKYALIAAYRSSLHYALCHGRKQAVFQILWSRSHCGKQLVVGGVWSFYGHLYTLSANLAQFTVHVWSARG